MKATWGGSSTLSIVPELAWTAGELTDGSRRSTGVGQPQLQPHRVQGTPELLSPFRPMESSWNYCHDKCGCFKTW